ncbi:MAG: response regulator transcription factor [Acidimicrobiia bacterium]|nr:response regulator transcription factor [Acidimicrobiia bacterium]
MHGCAGRDGDSGQAQADRGGTGKCGSSVHRVLLGGVVSTVRRPGPGAGRQIVRKGQSVRPDIAKVRDGGGVHLLMVEDDDAIAVPMARGLEREGFNVSRVETGEAALAASGYDLVLLDLGMPDMDGFAICHQLRARSDVPIIVVTARGDEADRVVGLELGADDYLVKPFGFRELVARIRAVARRVGGRIQDDGDARTLGALTIDVRTHRVTIGDEELALTPKEFDLLALLAEEPGALFERGTILERVWDPHWYGPTKTLDVHVATLRKKLGNPAWVETVRGVGFRLVDPDAG